MTVKDIYKWLVPPEARNLVAGHPWVLRLRNWQLVREGRRLAAAARAARKPDGKIYVAFIVQRPALWVNHASIYAAMQADPAFEASVIAIPKIPPAALAPDLAEYGRLMDFLAEKGIPFSKGYDESVRSWISPLVFGCPDIVFLPQPYAHTQGYLYHSTYLKHFCRVAYLSYGAALSHMPLIQYELPIYAACRWIFVESEAHKALFVAHAPALADRLFVTGHPKLDAYRESVPRDMGLWKCPLAKRRIIWAPHFTVTKDRTPHTFSNFFEYYEFFLGYAAAHPDVEFVLRPHPELFEHMVATGMKTRAEANAYRDRFNALPNGQVYEGGDIFQMFRQSDALLLDSIGFLSEYLPTGKPICFLDSPRRQRLNPIGEKLLHAFYSAWNAAEIEEFVDQVIAGGDDWRRRDRERAIRTCIYMPPAGAGAEIKNIIKRGCVCPSPTLE